MNLIKRLTSELHTEIDMTMYGVDVIVCPETGKHYVIDVNVFPGTQLYVQCFDDRQ